MDSEANEFLETVSPKKGRRSFKLFFGTLLGFAIALYLVPTEPIHEKTTPVRRLTQKPRTHIPVWTWKTLVTGAIEQFSPLMANTKFRGVLGENLRSDSSNGGGGIAPSDHNGSIRSARSLGSGAAKDALSRIAKEQTEDLAKNTAKRVKSNASAAQFLEGARVPGTFALMGAALMSGRSMKVRVTTETMVRAQIARDDGSRRDYRVNVERQIPGLGTSVVSGVSSMTGLNQISVNQSLGDGWNLGLGRSRVDRSIAGGASAQAENAVTLGFSSDF